MSTPIVIQLQELALDPHSDIDELLKKTLLVATKLKITELKDWCNLELNGYEVDALPEYRLVWGQLFAENPYHGLIPFVLPSDLAEIVQSVPIKESISEISNLLKLESTSFKIQLSPEMINILMQMQDSAFGGLMPRLVIDKSRMMAVVSAVKNKIFNWSLKLEEQDILGEGIQFSKIEKEAAMAINNYHIGSMQGIAGNVSGGTVNQQNQMTVSTANFDSLAKFLTNNGISYSDINDLEKAIKADPQPIAINKFGDKVSHWIGDMLGKAATGSWDVSIAVAGTLLAESISKFYGLG